MITSNQILKRDLAYIHGSLSTEERSEFHGAVMLVTGCAGFLGYLLMHYLVHYRRELGIRRIIGLDTFPGGKEEWVSSLSQEEFVTLKAFDVVKDSLQDVTGSEEVTHVMHMASIASPVFYRQYPLKTVDANVWGLRNLLDFYRGKKLRRFAFFSTSEIYGDAPPEMIPTPETYRGSVACIGPRACYDESKRFGETLSYYYHQQYAMPVTIIRPFNNYGPGLSLEDRRITADLAAAVVENRDMVLYSDGSPTRTYCYVADGIAGYLKALCYEGFEVFNIGADQPELTVTQLAEKYREIGREYFGYTGQIRFERSEDPHYLTDNPRRRCPDISKARDLLGFSPGISLEEGICSHLRFYQWSRREESK